MEIPALDTCAPAADDRAPASCGRMCRILDLEEPEVDKNSMTERPLGPATGRPAAPRARSATLRRVGYHLSHDRSAHRAPRGAGASSLQDPLPQRPSVPQA